MLVHVPPDVLHFFAQLSENCPGEDEVQWARKKNAHSRPVQDGYLVCLAAYRKSETANTSC